jgi:hypothetical protein
VQRLLQLYAVHGRLLKVKRSRLVTLSAVSAAVAVVCFVAAVYLRYVAVVAGVIAAVAVSIPLLISRRNWLFSLLTYAVSVTLGVVLGTSNIAYVAIIATYAMPLCLFKCFAEGAKGTDENEPKHIKPLVKWLVYYVICEVALSVTALLTWALMGELFTQLTAETYVVVLIVVAFNVAVPLLDLLFNGAIVLTKKAIAKSGILR